MENMYAWIDVSLPLRTGMPELPLNAAPEQKVLSARLERFFDVARGDKVTMSRMELNSHDGTHIDAPLHFFCGGQTIDKMPPETGIGIARVIEIRDSESIKPAELAKQKITAGERLLFKTCNSPGIYCRKQVGEFVYISTEAAEFLAEKKIRLVGFDYLTIGKISPPSNIKEVHEILLGNGIFVLEGLDLSRAWAGRCELVCLPLRIDCGDAAPARVVLRML